MAGASLGDVRRLALALPETSERVSRGRLRWEVRGKLFVWERPLRDPDLRALGSRAPEGPILGARVEHLGAKDALVADPSGVFFTTPHFEGYAAVLIQLDRIARDELAEVVVDAWLARAPVRVARSYVEERAG